MILMVDTRREQFSAFQGKENGKTERMSISVSLCLSNLKCYPWLETDASAAGFLVGLYAQLTDTLHHRFRGGFPAVPCSHMSECLKTATLWCLCC